MYIYIYIYNNAQDVLLNSYYSCTQIRKTHNIISINVWGYIFVMLSREPGKAVILQEVYSLLQLTYQLYLLNNIGSLYEILLQYVSYWHQSVLRQAPITLFRIYISTDAQSDDLMLLRNNSSALVEFHICGIVPSNWLYSYDEYHTTDLTATVL